MKKGKFTEQLTAIIEEALQGNGTVKVSHNVEIKNINGDPRQIDVLIEYLQNERFTFRTIIECKFKGRDGVEVNQMHAFIGTVKSLPGVHQGIFVSSNGFQKAARNLARANGIKLYTLSVLSKDDIKKWFEQETIIQKAIRQFDIIDWRILLREEDESQLPKGDYSTIRPDDQVINEKGETISIREIISALAPYRANQLHNHLLQHLIQGYDIFKEKFENTSIFPFQREVYLIKDGSKIPIGFLEIKFLFWSELNNSDENKYVVYKDQENELLASVIIGEELGIVEDQREKSRSYFVVKKDEELIKLELNMKIKLPDENQEVLIMKMPNT